MLNGRIYGATTVFGPPPGWDKKKDGPIPSLHVRKARFGRHDALISSFYPTLSEIQDMQHGAPVHLTLLSAFQPPVRLTVGEPADCMHPLPNALRVLSMAGPGKEDLENAVVIEFDRKPTPEQIEVLKDFLTRL